MSVLQSALLGLLQGLGEFLPVSSSGHLLLCRLFFGLQTDTPSMKVLDILLHIGTLIPVFLVFRKEWIDMICHPFRNKTLLLLFIASLPTLVIYLLAKKITPDGSGFSVFDSGWFLGCSFLISGLILLCCDVLAQKREKKQKSVIGIPQALLMGLFQGVGLIPGVSRSGSTICGGVVSGLSKNVAARFSFMMSAPAILVSFLVEAKDAVNEGYINEIEFFPALIGFLVAAVVGYFSIRFMLKLIARVPLSWFAVYLCIVGVIFLLLQAGGADFLPALGIPSVSSPAV